MMSSPRFRSLMAAILLLPAPALIAQETETRSDDKKAEEKDPIALIKKEGMEDSKVMETLSYLSDVIGPRLTASTGMKRANEWTRDKLAEWGLQNAHLEAWGPFGRGGSRRRWSSPSASR